MSELIPIEQLDLPARWKERGGQKEGYDPVPEMTLRRGVLGELKPTRRSLVYQVTTLALQSPEPQTGTRQITRHRTPGLFRSLTAAHVALQENMGDMHEAGYYPKAVVEAVGLDGVYLVSTERAWYRWDENFEGFRPCPEPAGFEHSFAFGGVG